MNPQLKQRMEETFAQHFNMPPHFLSNPGTTLLMDEKMEPERWHELYTIGERVILTAGTEVHATLREFPGGKPDDYRLTMNDVQSLWENIEVDAEKFYGMNAEKFLPQSASEGFIVRQLRETDQKAFDDFLARCTESEREAGEISIQDEICFGVLDGNRIVSGASVYDYMGFAEPGVLTDPAYRRKGLSKACLSRLCQHYLDHDARVFMYRHDVKNLASQYVAEGIGFSLYARFEAFKIRP